MNESLTEDYPPTTTDYIPPSIPQTLIRTSTLKETIASSGDTSSYEDLIVSNIRNFLKTSKTKGGAHNIVDTATRDAVLTACTFGLPNEVKKDSVREVLGVSKRSFYKRLKTLPPSICSQTYIPPKRKVRVTKIGPLQKESIAEFCHSDESSSIDSNSRKIIIVAGEQHVGRVWSVKTVNEQYSLFKQSEVIERYIDRYPDFVIPSRSTFIKYRCACVSPPVMQSCVDICTSGLMHYMRALAKFVRKRSDIRDQLNACGCDQHKKQTNKQTMAIILTWPS